MSIVRVGLSETKKFGEGYDAIFSKKKGATAKKAPAAKAKSSAKKKPARKK